MKSSHPKITLLGSNSGNNLGDAAILSAILESLTKELPDAEFFVPTTNKRFIEKHYGSSYNVKAVDVMPWTGSIRLFGIPTLLCLAKSDVALICDGIIFGKKFFNPAFNFLITLFLLLPFFKLFRCKLVCFSCGIGPFPVSASRLAARMVMNASDLVIMRERDSKALAEDLGVTQEIFLSGDAAFLNPVNGEEQALKIIDNEGLDPEKEILGINLTSYIDSWLNKDEQIGDKEEFKKVIIDGISSALNEIDEDLQAVFFSTHPMDETFASEVAKAVGGKTITNTHYLSHDIQAVMRKAGLLIGMRFHSLILASAVETPIVGLVYAPKVRGYMRLLNCEEYSLELASLSASRLKETLVKAWRERKQLQTEQRKVVDELKSGAQKAVRMINERFFSARGA